MLGSKNPICGGYLCRYLVDMQVPLYWSEASKLWRWKTGGGGLSLVCVEGSLWRRPSLFPHTGGTGPPLKPGVSTEESVGGEGGGQGAPEDGLESSGLFRAEVVEADKLLVSCWRARAATEGLLAGEADRASSGPSLAGLELTAEESERLLLGWRRTLGRNPRLGLAQLCLGLEESVLEVLSWSVLLLRWKEHRGRLLLLLLTEEDVDWRNWFPQWRRGDEPQLVLRR